MCVEINGRLNCLAHVKDAVEVALFMKKIKSKAGSREISGRRRLNDLIQFRISSIKTKKKTFILSATQKKDAPTEVVLSSRLVRHSGLLLVVLSPIHPCAQLFFIFY